jgi:hypothetical protein
VEALPEGLGLELIELDAVLEIVCVPDIDGDEEDVPDAEIEIELDVDADADADALVVGCPAICMKSKKEMQKCKVFIFSTLKRGASHVVVIEFVILRENYL